VTETGELSEFVRTLQRSSDLVHEWADAPVDNRSTLRQLLQFHGLPGWEMLAADLALYRIPPALRHSSTGVLSKRLRRRFRAMRHALRPAAAKDESDCARWPQRPVALFLGFTPYITRDILLPVVTAMEMRDGLAPVVLSDHPRGRPDGTARGRHSVSRHWTNDTAKDAQQIAGAVHSAFRALARDPEYRRVFSDGGQSLWPSVRENVMDLGLYAQHEISRCAASARHFLSHHRPAVVVSPDVADARTRAFTLLAAQRGVPTVEVQFGACGPEATEWRFFAADRAAVWGTQSGQVLVSHGVPADRVVVTGSPRHDALFNATSADVREFRDRFRIPLGNVAVVFGSTSSTMSAYDNAGDNATLREMKRAIFAAAATFPNLTLIVKPHPLENVDETRALSAGAANVVFADPAEDIRGLSRVCEAFITFGSASTLDALILGKPTLCPAFPGWRWNDLFVDTGAVAVPQTLREIEAAMRDLVERRGETILAAHAGARDAFLSAWVHDGGRGGTERVIDLLESAVRVDDRGAE
jgi:hypothetical protein